MYSDDGYFAAAPPMRRAVSESAAALRGLGATVEPFRPPDVGEAMRLCFAHTYADGLDFARPWLKGEPVDQRIRAILRKFNPEEIRPVPRVAAGAPAISPPERRLGSSPARSRPPWGLDLRSR
jgi:Amidase